MKNFAKTLLIAFLAVFILSAFNGCRSTKGGTSIYSGDGPNMHYTDAEAPGRAMKDHKYR